MTKKKKDKHEVQSNKGVCETTTKICCLLLPDHQKRTLAFTLA